MLRARHQTPRLIFSSSFAVTNSPAVLIVFRFLAGTFASCPMANAAGAFALTPRAPATVLTRLSHTGSIADVWSINERGHKMSAFSSILFVAPCLGPVFGGYMAMNISWRWLYWLQAIMAGVLFFVVLFLYPET